ncbi:MAG: glycosyltransferase family 4 protein [Parcubacteria group bacterium]
MIKCQLSMKIIYGITKSNFGGAQRYVFELARESSKLGHEVTVLCGLSQQTDGKGVLIEKLRKENIEVISIPSLDRDVSPFNDIRSFLFMFEVLGKLKPDVFHMNSSKMGILGGIAGRLAGVNKIIFTSHGWAFNEDRPWYQKLFLKIIYWKAIMFSHKTICVSDKTREAVAHWPFVRNKLVVIKNSIEEFNLIERSKARLVLMPGILADTLLIGTIAELHHVKGLDILLQAWQRFIKHDKAELVIIGEGEERNALEHMIQNLGIEDSVILKGFVEDARSLLSGFDIFCMPSRSEAMPYALLEAGLAGLPVIATPVGGIPEVIESGINGVFVPVENAEALFSTMILLAEDFDLRKRLGTTLKASIQENFSFEKMVSQTLALY